MPRLIRDADTAVLVWSMGITQHVFGGDAVQMILNLGLTKGYVGRDKCGLMPIRGHSGVQGGAEMGAYATAFPGGLPINAENAEHLSTRYGFPVPERPGLSALEMVEAASRGEIDLLYSVGGNFLRTLPNPDYVVQALANVPMRVHQDIVVTEPMLLDAREDVLLLPAKTRYEQDDGGTETSTERRVMFSPEIPRQVGEARAEWHILRDLAAAVDPAGAERLGCETGAAIRREIAEVVPFYEGIQHLTQSGESFQYGGPHLCAGWEFHDRRRQGALPRRAPAGARSRPRLVLAQHATGETVQQHGLRGGGSVDGSGARRRADEPGRRRGPSPHERRSRHARERVREARRTRASRRHRARQSAGPLAGGERAPPPRGVRRHQRRAGLQRPGSRRGRARMTDAPRGRIVRWEKGAEPSVDTDELAGEEPLEIRVGGRPVSVTMRTPGEDEELAIGFLLSEGLIHTAADVRSAAPLTPGEPCNVVDVELAPGVHVDFESLTRHVFASSSCGLCGKVTIDSVHRQFPPVASDIVVDAATIVSLPARARAAQAAFERTGGLHAAALFDEHGELLVLREDVGRHNAVDKVVGYGLTHGLLPFDRHVLLVSGRASFEIMQKALAARVPIVAAVSAPSSLAVEFAEASRQTLVAFVREGRMNVYAGVERIRFEGKR